MSDSATGLRALARRHPIALYLAIVFGVGLVGRGVLGRVHADEA